MFNGLWAWIGNGVTSAVFFAGVVYFFRDALSGFLSKAIEHRFERRLEEFKTNIRNNEKELEQIRSFLISTRMGRDAVIQSKRLEAAEILLQWRHKLHRLSILVEYMKIFDTERLINTKDPKKYSDLFNQLVAPLEIEEKLRQYADFDKTYPRLYLGEKTLRVFAVYERIILQAATVMTLLAMDLPGKGDFIKSTALVEMVIDLVPSSREGFEEFGASYIYYWADHFHDEILRVIRYEISGIDDAARDIESIESLAMDARRTQKNIEDLTSRGFSDAMIRPDERAMRSAAVAKGLSDVNV